MFPANCIMMTANQTETTSSMSQIKIRGLVKAMNHVRRKLSAGIHASDAEAFRAYVLGTITQAEEICRKNRITPKQLPAPSRRAYQVLKTLDLRDLPPMVEGSPGPANPLRIKRLISRCTGLHVELDRLARRLAAEPGLSFRGEQAAIMDQIQALTRAVDSFCEKAGATPASLPLRSRRAYQWLMFLSDMENLSLHLTTLSSAHHALQSLRARPQISQVLEKKPLLELYPTSYLYRTQQKAGLIRIMLNEGFLGAPQEVLEALMRVAAGHGSSATKKRIRQYASSEDFAEIVQTVEFIDSEPIHTTQGRTYDLAVIFENVNAAYFEARLERPRLTWNRTLSRRKFGHYQAASDTVMISITLDDPAVPGWVIDFVMYHELLHKALGTEVKKGRRYVHTRDFREHEKKFQRFEEAQGFLDQLARE